MSIFKRLYFTVMSVALITTNLFSSTSLGIPFVKNQGQIKDRNVAYHAKTFSGGFFVLKNGTIVHSLSNKKIEIDNTTTVFETLNNIKKPNFSNSDKSNLKVNFFYGKPSQWITNLDTYRVVDYGNIYDGIDLKLLSHDNNIEKLFVVEPNTNPNKIDISLKGAENLRTSFDGKLLATTKLGDISFTKPVAWTEDGDKVTFVDIAYRITKNGYGFKLGNYDKSQTLVIDPLLGSTFIGGTNADEILDLDINKSTNTIYAAGHTLSSLHTNLSLTPGRTYTANKDGFIVVLNEDLNQSSHMTYIGGSGNDEIKAIDINETDGSIYITGITESSNFPTTVDGNDTSYNGSVDGFVSKLNHTLSSIDYSTYIGGTGDDILADLAIDDAGYVYVTGYTVSSENSLPVVSGEGNDTTQNGNYDSVTFKLNYDLSTVINSTFLGTLASDGSRVIEINGSNVYVGGFTGSSTFPNSNTGGSGVEGFIVQLDMNLTDGNSSMINGNGNDEIYGLDFNYSSGVVVVGTTSSTNLAGAGIIGGNKDGFLASFNFDLSGGAQEISYLGGSDNDEIRAINIDSDNNNTFVTGYTTSSASSTLDFNTTGSIYQGVNNGNGDVFVSKYINGIKDLNGSTFIGGSNLDLAHTIKIGKNGSIFVGGVTASSDFPKSNVTGTILSNYSADDDGFLFKIDENLSNNYSVIETTATSSNIDLTTTSQYFHFKNVELGSESNEIITTITNTGTSTLNITSMDFNNTTLGYSLKFRSSDSSPCNISSTFTLSAKSSCTFGMTLTPSMLNEANATLTINNDSNQTEHNITIAGIGVLAGVQNIVVTPEILDFQNRQLVAINNYLDLNITIMNKGNNNLVVSDINVSDGNFSLRYMDSGLTCGGSTPTVGADTNCTFAVRFEPSLVDDFNQTVQIKSNDPDTPIKTIKVNGRSVAGISANPVTKDFGNIISGTNSNEFNITVTNNGVANLTITGDTLHVGTQYTVTQRFGDCSAYPATISTGEDCNISVRFNPATNSMLNDTLKIASNDSAYPELNVSLTGTGVSPSSGHIDSNVTVKNFGTANLGSTTEYNDIKISNAGLADIVVSAMNLNGSAVFNYDFTKGSKPCGSATPTITSNDYCTIGISFTPANSVNYEHNLSIESNAGNGELNISMVGTGVINNSSALSLTYFSASPTYGTPPLNTDFNITVTGGSGNYTYLWDFNDSTTSTDQNRSHTFTNAGDYNVSVRVSDTGNPSNFIIVDTNVTAVLASNYTPVTIQDLNLSSSSGSAPFSVDFNLSATGGSGTYTYLWNFGDGNTSASQNPTNNFTSEGNYTINVTIIDTVNTANRTTGKATIVVSGTPQASPVTISGFTVSKSAGAIPLATTFSITPSGGSGNYTYAWKFGDGNTSTLQNPSYSYSSAGNYNVTVTITDANDGTNSTTGTATIVALNTSTLSIGMTATPTSGSIPLEVAFSGTVTGGTPPYTLTWNFGDGENTSQTIYSGAFNKSHTYTKAGSFETALMITSASSGGVSTARISSSMGIEAKNPLSSQSSVDPTGGDGDYCFIATAAYGSLLEPEVTILREFRDQYLRGNEAGQWFIKTYYDISPPIATYIGQHTVLKGAVRILLTPIVYFVKYMLESSVLILLSIIFMTLSRQRMTRYNPKQILKTTGI